MPSKRKVSLGCCRELAILQAHFGRVSRWDQYECCNRRRLYMKKFGAFDPSNPERVRFPLLNKQARELKKRMEEFAMKGM